MATYLIQIAFTADSIANLVANPENRRDSMVPILDQLGGHFIGSWLSFGEYDSTAIIEMPDNISIKAFEMACFAGKGLRFYNITPLMSFEDGLEAMKIAKGLNYKAPVKED